MIRWVRGLAAAGLVAGLLVGCADGADGTDESDTASTAGESTGDAAGTAGGAGAASSGPVRMPGTPEGDLETWVADIRTGLAQVPAMIPDRLQEARDTTVALYVGRQEWLERYYGTIGTTLVPDTAAALPQSIMEAESRFHALMQLVTGSEPTREAVQVSVDSVDVQFQRVLDAARAAPPPPIPADTAGGAI